MDPKTHHTIRNAYLAQPKDRKWQIMATYPDQYPADTGGRLRPDQEPDDRQAVRTEHLGLMDLVGLLAFNVVTGIATLVLITLGLGVIYGMMRVINLAHGEFMMLGAYTAVIANQAGVNIWISMLVLPPLLVGLVGLVLERTLIRFLYGRIIDTMLATWGVSLGLIGLMATIFGNVVRAVPTPVGGFSIGRYGASLYGLVIVDCRRRQPGRHAGAAALHEIRPDPARHNAEPQHGRRARAFRRRPSTWRPSRWGPRSPALPAACWRRSRAFRPAWARPISPSLHHRPGRRPGDHHRHRPGVVGVRPDQRIGVVPDNTGHRRRGAAGGRGR